MQFEQVTFTNEETHIMIATDNVLCVLGFTHFAFSIMMYIILLKAPL